MAPFILVVDDTFNDELHVVIPFNIAVPDTFKVPFIEVELHNTLLINLLLLFV